MTAYINKLKDKDSNQQLPITHERAVRDDNGTTAETKFQNLEGAMDKAYVAQSDNGMGRITLKKNMVSGVNTLTQSMMQATNTIYVIQYDFTLGEDITVPKNCVLEFDGGSINGETIQLNEGCSIVNGKFTETTLIVNNKNCSILNTSVINTTKACVEVSCDIDVCYPKDNLRIEGCILETSYDGNGSVPGCAIRWHINNSDMISKNVRIVNNIIKFTYMGFELTQSGGRTGRECLENAVFADNVFEYIYAATTSAYLAISLPDNMSDNVYCNKNIVIANNVIKGNGRGRGFELAGEQITVTGNTILNSGGGSFLASGWRIYTNENQETVYMRALRNSIISNNNFSEQVNLQSAENVIVEGNVIDTMLLLGDTTPYGYWVENIKVVSNRIAQNIVIDRNDGHSNYALRMGNARNIYIRNNSLATNWSGGIIWSSDNASYPTKNVFVENNYVSLRGKWPFFIKKDYVVSKNNIVEFDTFIELIDYKYGTSKFGSGLAIANSNLGDIYFNTSIGGRPTYNNGTVWIDGNGHSAALIKGNTASRPKGVGTSGGILDASRDIGFQYFDTTLGKPVFVSAIANDGTVTWVDATGTPV